MHKAVAKAVSAILLMLLNTAVASTSLDAVTALLEAGNHQQALEQLDREPQTRASRLLRANALAGLKRNAEAEALYRLLINEAPADPVPYNNLAALYAATGRLQEASELLNQGIASDERYATIHKNLSKVYVAMSRNSYAKALRMSDQPPALQLRALLPHDGSPAAQQVAAVTRTSGAPQPAVALAAQPAPETGATPKPKMAPVAEPPMSVAPISPPAVVPQSAPEPMVAVPAASGDFDAGGAIARLREWAAAWSAQNVAGYLAAYDVDYLPPRGLSLAQWQAERRARLRKPGKIEVMLSDFEVSSGGGGSLTVKLLQRYRSESYRDTTRKGFVMVRRAGGWKIGDEYTIEVIN